MTWEECYDRALAVVAEMADKAFERVEGAARWDSTATLVGRSEAFNEVFDKLVDLKKEVIDA